MFDTTWLQICIQNIAKNKNMQLTVKSRFSSYS